MTLIIKSIEYFSKEVFSKNLRNYKIISQNEFGYNPSRINVGSVGLYKNKENGLISPLYVIFECNSELKPEYLLHFLKSPKGNQIIRCIYIIIFC